VTFPRRDVLRAALFGGVAAVLAACGFATPSTPAQSLTPTTPPPTAPPSATPTAVATPSPTPGPTLEAKIAGLLIVGFRGMSLDAAAWVRDALRDRGLRGVILFDRDQLTGGARNVKSPAQVASLVRDLRAATGTRPIVVSIDQEGGVVTRLSPKYGFPAVTSEAAIGTATTAATRTWAATIANTLESAGINLNYAPVVDLDVNPDSPAIGALDRSFSRDPDVVVAKATIEIDAHRTAGVRTTLKHFPGIGSSTTNTDFGVADVTKTWTRTELEPFQRLIASGKADVVMAGHVVNHQLDPKYPASLSSAVVTTLLRGELGWDGVVVTDDLQAAAITQQFGRDEAIVRALNAGNDLLLLANQQAYDARIVDHAVAAVTAAIDSGRLPVARIDEAWSRVEALFGQA
jgi:beta-N-acetylhexosaminidase